MNKAELKSLLDKKEKNELIDIILDLHKDIPRIRQNIYNLVSPPVINWKELHDVCIDPVIIASTSNKINRLGIPSAALSKFTEFSPEKDIAMEYIYESFEILVKGLLSLKFLSSFNYSWVGGYGYECRKYMKKRHWLDSDEDAKLAEIVEKYFNPSSEGYKYILLYADINISLLQKKI